MVRSTLVALALAAVSGMAHAAVVPHEMGSFSAAATTFDFDGKANGASNGRDFGDFTTSFATSGGSLLSLSSGVFWGSSKSVSISPFRKLASTSGAARPMRSI